MTTAMKATAIRATTAELSPSVTAESFAASTPEASAIEVVPAAKTMFPAFEAASVKPAASIVTPPIKAGPAIEAMEPRARSDEDTADEVVRAVIAVGRAGVRIISIVAIGANRSRAEVTWARSNADKDSLCMGE